MKWTKEYVYPDECWKVSYPEMGTVEFFFATEEEADLCITALNNAID